MKKILVIGSINMDYTVYVNKFPEEGETLYGKGRFIQPGGKGENQAVAIAKAGKADLNFLGAIGNDNDGEQIKKILANYKVNASLKICDGVPTGNATIVVDSSSENKIIIIEGANGELKEEDINIKLLEEADYIVLQNEIPAKTNEFIIKTGVSLGKIIVYNPAPYRAMDLSLLKGVSYIIPNKIELFQLTNENDYRLGAKKLLELGVKNVLVTLGNKGSILINEKEEIAVDAFKVNAIDTVAAGDTYVGYFTASIASGYSIKEAMNYASKASSITVQRKGSVVSIPYGKEVY